MAEQWRPVKGYENAYEVSDLGHVRSVTREVRGRDGSTREIQGKLLTPRIRPDGTWATNLWVKNEYRQIPVRRIVLEAFDRPRPAGFDAVNVNEDPADNRLSNLQWEPDKRVAAGVRRLLAR